MTSFAPATTDQLLAIRVNAGIDELAQADRFAAAEPDLVEAIVEGIGQFAAGEFAPLNRVGDSGGASSKTVLLRSAQGLPKPTRLFRAGLERRSATPSEFGGQGLPFTLACNVIENLGSANMAFTLLPILSVGAVEALAHHGTPAQQAMYLPKLVSGEWSGTMNLTEPQAGSDVGALRASAEPIAAGEHAGKYRIAGTKMFITWGDHDLSENIAHLVLARLPGAPEGSRGISLFLVPRYHVAADGTLGARNDLRAVSLEHKLGIHASPTCVMSFGDKGECIGELVGAENRGLVAMFTMMNKRASMSATRACRSANARRSRPSPTSRDRVQGAREGNPTAIIEHPDVRRMLLRMRRGPAEGARALLLHRRADRPRHAGRCGRRAPERTGCPLLKRPGATDGASRSQLGVQVHGGRVHRGNRRSRSIPRQRALPRSTKVHNGTRPDPSPQARPDGGEALLG